MICELCYKHCQPSKNHLHIRKDSSSMVYKTEILKSSVMIFKCLSMFGTWLSDGRELLINITNDKSATWSGVIFLTSPIMLSVFGEKHGWQLMEIE